ncbi:hypothetical protein ECZC06_55540 [Escherichia coli]|nr:hypothetical protein ECZC06_55540 [Escherichia coli]
MRNGVPLLELRAAQLPGITHIPHGTSLAFALFIEAARRDLPTLIRVHKELFFLQKKGIFWTWSTRYGKHCACRPQNGLFSDVLKREKAILRNGFSYTKGC